MTANFKGLIGSKTVQEILKEDAIAIKKRGEDVRVFTYQERNDHGFVTAKARPVPKDEERLLGLPVCG